MRIAPTFVTLEHENADPARVSLRRGVTGAMRPAAFPFPSEAARRRVIAASILLLTMVGVALSLTIPLLALDLERMGVSSFWSGLNVAVAGIATIITAPLVPAAAARFGLRLLVLVATLVCIVAILAFALQPAFPLWFPLRFALGAALGTLFVLSEYLITASAPPDRRGMIMGLYATMLALGFALGPLILALVGTRGPLPYLTVGALFAAALVPLAALGGAMPHLEKGPRKPVLSFVAFAPAATCAALVYGAIETGAFAHLPVFGVRLGYSETSASLLVSALALGNVVFQIPIGILSDHFDRRRMLAVIGATSMALALLIVPLIGQPPLLAMALFLLGGVSGALYTVGLAHLGSRFAGNDLAAANAAFVLLYSVGLIAGPPLVGASLDVMGHVGLALSLAGMLALYTVIAVARMFGASRAGP